MALDPRHLEQLQGLLLPTLGPAATELLIEMLRDSDPDHPRHGLAAMRADLDQRFADIDQRFADIDRRFEQVDRRFEQVDHRFALVEAKIEDSKNELLAAFRGELVTAVAGQTRSLLLGMFGTVVTMSGLAFALARFV